MNDVERERERKRRRFDLFKRVAMASRLHRLGWLGQTASRRFRWWEDKRVCTVGAKGWKRANSLRAPFTSWTNKGDEKEEDRVSTHSHKVENLSPMEPARDGLLEYTEKVGLSHEESDLLEAGEDLEDEYELEGWEDMEELGDVIDEEDLLSSRQRRRIRTKRRKLMQKHDFVLGKLRVAIVGRPNVGKSTLFNRLVKRQEAIVSKIPGTTRDRKEGKARLGELEFRLVDTGGFESIDRGRKSPTELLAPEHGVMLVQAMHEQTKAAIEDADVVLMVVDAKEGITQDDVALARWVRKHMGEPPFSKEELEEVIDGLVEKHGLTKHWFEPKLTLVANKTENMGEGFAWGNSDLRWADFLQECYRLGFGDPIPISAEHNVAIGDLHNALLPYAILQGEKEAMERQTRRQVREELADKEEDVQTSTTRVERDEDKPITISMIGRPNVGKSTLVNSLLGERRCIAGPVAGLTRDAIQIDWEYNGRPLRLVDTAGIRRRTKLFGGLSSAMAAANRFAGGVEVSTAESRKNDAHLEDLSIQNSLRAVDFSQIVVMVVDIMETQGDPDASGALTKHDLSIISRVLDEGRGLVIVANKCDLTDANWQKAFKDDIITYVRRQLEDVVPLARGVPIIPLSAEEKQNVDKLMPCILETFDKWCTRISTSKLNTWLQEAQLKQPPPAKRGATYRKKKVMSGPLRIKYITQPSSRPPSFVLFVNRFNPKPNVIPEDYQRYLFHSLRKRFNLEGIPVRFSVRGSTKLTRRRPT